jgi:PAS domain-containing protein
MTTRRTVTRKTRSLPLGELEVIEAETDRGLALIAERQPPLVLVDVNCPTWAVWPGRRSADWPDIIVIQISATATSGRESHWLRAARDCYLDDAGRANGIDCRHRAMPRLRRAEAQARESGERYRMIVESAIDYAIFTADWTAGSPVEPGTGDPRVSPEDIIGEPCARIFMADDIIADVPNAEMRAAFQGISVYAERWHRRREGSRFWSSGRMVALRDRRGEVAGFLKILYDRSVEKAARDALEALNAELEDRVAERTIDLAEANEKLRAEITERNGASKFANSKNGGVGPVYWRHRA